MNITQPGDRFGRWTVIEPADPIYYYGHSRPQWKCRCDCGTESVLTQNSLRRGKSRSCGCLRREMSVVAGVTHGLSRSSEYGIWSAMKARCINPNVKAYARYGGRGIKVCERWLAFENFYADMGRRPSDAHTLERRDNNGGYEPENCLWDTRRRQANNRHNNRRIEFNGNVRTLMDWSRVLGISRNVIEARLRRGWSVERTLTTAIVRPRRQP